MPNWCTNRITFVASNDEILRFFNDGLKQQDIKPLFESIDEINFCHWLTNRLSLNSWIPRPAIYDIDTTNAMRKRDDVNWKDNTPMFNSDEEYAAYVKKYEDAITEQSTKYGVIGWYDWNVKNWGTKWNTYFESITIIPRENNQSVVEMYCETAWNPPTNWLYTITEKYDFYLCLHATDEAFMFDFIHNYKTDEIKEYTPTDDEYEHYKDIGELYEHMYEESDKLNVELNNWIEDELKRNNHKVQGDVQASV